MLVKGIISNKQSGETLPGSQVYISDASGNLLNPPRGVAANASGLYSINANVGDYLTATFVGLKRKTVKVTNTTTIIDFPLELGASSSLEVIEVIAKKPFPWKLIIAIALLTGGVIYFSVDFLKYKKII